MSTKTNPKNNRLLVRSDFLRVAASGIRFVSSGFVLQKSKEEASLVRYGLTATKKLGNAVARNRARRRLRALAENHLLKLATPGDYVLVAREAIATREFTQLISDLEKALKVLKCQKVSS
ncbi:MAG: ribonuclease P protein component [Alphaproteobacteria bacterium]|nr:ribonuclease P protein component [Alphaproteobacteria bacterium]